MGPAGLTPDEYRAIAEQAPALLWRADAGGGRDYFNEGWLAFTGRPLEQELGEGWLEGVHPEDRSTCRSAPAPGESFERHYRLRRRDGDYCWVAERAVPFGGPDGRFAGHLGSTSVAGAAAVGTLRGEQRLEALLRLGEMRDRSLQEVLDFGLEEAVRLTESRVGYLYFYDDEKQLFTLYSWSRSTLAECGIADKQTVYELHDTGLWGEAVRRRRPIVVNDFGAEHPWKRGCPEGHVKLRRYLTVPVFEGERIVAVAGMGNKDAPYDGDDVRQLQLYMDRLWAIVERQRAEEALRASEERFRRLVATVPHGVEELDLEGRLIFCNPALERIMGCAPGTLVGRHVFDLMAPEADRAEMAAYWEDLVTRQPPPAPYIGRNRTDDGRLIDVLVDWDYARAADGSLRGFVAVVTDVTAQRSAEQRLTESEERFRLFMRHAPFVVTMKDRDSRLLYVNERFGEVFGVPPAEAVGRRLSELLPAAGAEALEEAERAALDRDEAVRSVGMLPFPGEPRHWDTVRFPIPEADGRRRILGVIAADVTDRVVAEERERTYRSRLQRLAAELSLAGERERRTIAAEMHDAVGQVLALARLRLGALGARCPVRACTADLDELGQLVELALKDTRSLCFELSPPALYQLGLEPALEQLAEHVSARTGIPFEFADDGAPKPVDEGLRVLLYQATRELLVNAAKHARARQGRVAVWAEGDQVCIEVADDGVGMVAEAAFPSREGGFGLFSIRERLQDRGGRLEIDSRPGGGTRVRLFAPLAGGREA